MLISQALEEFLGRSIGLTLQPRDNQRPRDLERILARSPVARRLRPSTVRRADLAVSPGVPETLEEAIEIGIAVWKHVDAVTCCQACEVMLYRSNLIEESEWIERDEYGSQPILHRFRDLSRRQQPSTRRLGGVISLANTGPDTFLLGELERGLEKVHEQARCGIEARERLARRDALQPSVADEPSDHGPVLLLDPGLIVLPIRP